jgi:hypothetical protein
VIRIVCLLLVIPSLLMPPGMCICRLVESGEFAGDVEHAAALEQSACCEHCCHFNRPAATEASDDESAPYVPVQHEKQCAFAGITAVHPPVPERVGSPIVLAFLDTASIADPALVVRSTDSGVRGDVVPQSSPVYISNCALLI